MTLLEVLNYEIMSSRWAKLISNPMLQDIAGWYYARKAKRKYKRYLYNKKIKEEILKR